MRVLFAATPPISKVFALAPLAWAFRAAGHETLLTYSEQIAQAAETGLQVVDAAPGTSGNAILAELFAARPELVERWLEPLGDDPAKLAPGVAELNRPFLPTAVELADHWRPDLVVFEQSAPYGLVAAARAGVPAVQRNLGTIRTAGVHDAVLRLLAADLERLGVPDVPSRAALTLEFVPPGMLPFPTPEGEFMRYVPYTGGAGMQRLPTRGDRPRVVVTLGSIRPDMHGLGPLEATVAAAAETDAEFLLALGDADPAPLGALPPNVRPIGWTPMDLLLPTCAGVVHHGGGGTALAAIWAGVPQLVA
ncbi:nucleotide disphospho-sugar-binding domain-containing protein, partial [Spirillospora sp. NPDC049652]